ncbi:recombination protein RecR [Anaplasmataceae bacterium AB001_6]|nr:recombination protein RecR [Anaplasmataceae bacterium AB001_6]
MPPILDKLVKLFSLINGVGHRSAKRIVLTLVKDQKNLVLNLSKLLKDVADNVKCCSVCNNIDDSLLCYVCSDENRVQDKLCIVEDVSDLWTIESSNIFNGVYHVLGGCLSALEGVTPEDLKINSIIDRIKKNSISEVIIATNLTIDGRTTGYYISDLIKKHSSTKVTGLAYGIPVGGEINYLDESTLEFAFMGRKEYE